MMMEMMVTFAAVVVGVCFLIVYACAGDEPSVKRSKLESDCVDKSSLEWKTQQVVVISESVDAAILSSDRIWLSSLSEILKVQMAGFSDQFLSERLSDLSKSE